jgi:hypothetical protein
VDLAVMPDDGTEPGPADWLPASWLTSPAGQLLGAGLLAGPGALVVAAGDHMMFVREHLADGTVPVREWCRLTVGISA